MYVDAVFVNVDVVVGVNVDVVVGVNVDAVVVNVNNVTNVDDVAVRVDVGIVDEHVCGVDVNDADFVVWISGYC